MKTLVKSTILLLIIFFISCDNDDGIVEPTLIDKSFKLNFTNGFNSAEGWVILHSEDGQSATSVKSFYGDAVIDFGKVEAERVTFTYIYTKKYGETNYYYINSYLSAPKGDWVFDGNNYSHKGKVNIDLSYPTGDYDKCFCGTDGFSSRRSLSGITDSYNFSERDIYHLNSEQKLSIFGSVFNFDTDSAYYSWKPNQQFNLGETNSYNLNLSTLMEPSFINANRPFDYVSIYAAPFNTKDRVKLFYGIYDNSEQQKVFYPKNFSAIKFRTSVSIWENDFSYLYSKFGEKVYTNLSIPNGVITATYNENMKIFENISTTENVDITTAFWGYYDSEKKTGCYWYVRANSKKTSIQRPVIPNEVLSQISNLDISQIESNEISILDYDTVSSYDDILALWYKSNKNFYDVVNEFYSYRMKIN